MPKPKFKDSLPLLLIGFLFLTFIFSPYFIPNFHFFTYGQFEEIRLAKPGSIYYFVFTPQGWRPFVEMQKKDEQFFFKKKNGEWESFSGTNLQWLKHRYYLGSDRLGRDFLYRVILGGRFSFLIALLAVEVGLLIGVTLGMIAGYGPRWLDWLILWLMTTFWSIPSILLAMALAFILGKGLVNLVIAIGLVIWTDIARIIRGETLKLKELEYIQAAKVLGIPSYRILIKHLIPNVAPYIWVLGANAAATAILLESGLSFLGFGLRPPEPSWGNLLKEHYYYVFTKEYWHLVFLPGFMIMVTILLIRFMSLNMPVRR